MMTFTEKGIALTMLALLNVVAITVGFMTGIVGVMLAVIFLVLSATAGAKILRM